MTADTKPPAPGPWVPPGLSPREILVVLVKQAPTILVFFAAVLLTAVAVTWLMKPVYEASAAFLLKRSDVPLSPGDDSASLARGRVEVEDLNSEIEILRSTQLFEDVARRLGLEPKADAADSSEFDLMVEDLEENLWFETVGRSNVISATYRATDSDLVVEVLEALIDAYLDRRTKIFQTVEAVDFFEQRLQEAKERLNAAERALEERSRAAGVTVLSNPGESDPLSTQKELVLQRLTSYETELAADEVAVQEKSRRVQALRQQLAEEPERLPSSDRDNIDPETETLERGLAALRLELDELLQTHRPESSRVRNTQEQIRLAENRLRQAEERRGGISGTERNLSHQQLKSELQMAEAELAAARARREARARSLEQEQRRVQQLNSDAFELDRLQRELTAAEAAFFLIEERHEEARISAAMDQQRMVNVSVIREPQRPVDPVAPNPWRNLALAVVVGAFGGIGLGYARQHFDRSFTSGQEVERQLGIPLLATLPEEGRH